MSGNVKHLVGLSPQGMSLQACSDIMTPLLAASRSIEEQLSSRERAWPDGTKMTVSEHGVWRRGALKAKNGIDLTYREFKNYVRLLKRQEHEHQKKQTQGTSTEANEGDAEGSSSLEGNPNQCEVGEGSCDGQSLPKVSTAGGACAKNYRPAKKVHIGIDPGAPQDFSIITRPDGSTIRVPGWYSDPQTAPDPGADAGETP